MELRYSFQEPLAGWFDQKWCKRVETIKVSFRIRFLNQDIQVEGFIISNMTSSFRFIPTVLYSVSIDVREGERVI